MKMQNMFRPMFMMGVILVALVVFSYLLIPTWRSSLPHLALLVILGLMGITAAIYDTRRLIQDIKDSNRKQG